MKQTKSDISKTVAKIYELDARVHEITSPPYRTDHILIGAEGQPSVGVQGNSCRIEFSSERRIDSDEQLEEIRENLKKAIQPMMDFGIDTVQFGFEAEALIKGEKIYDLMEELPDERRREVTESLNNKS
jgi:hypothetical protein